MGDTRAIGLVSAATVEPFQDRPNEGAIKVNVELSSLGSEDWDPEQAHGRSREEARVSSLLEHAVLEARAVDLEGLCIVAGRKVWSIQVDVCVVNNAGNVVDCACLAAFGALSHFRRPDVAVVGDSVTVFDLDEREPVALSLHHTPLCLTFALFNRSSSGSAQEGGSENAPSGEVYFVVDPTDREELAQDGQLTVIVNAHKEVCGIHKAGWPPLDSEQIARLVSLASERAPVLAKHLEGL